MMKRLLFALCMLVLVTCQSIAVPAHSNRMKVKQPDGSLVTIQLHGDEWLHFNTTGDGYTVVKNQNGYYVYAEVENGLLKPTTLIAHDADQRTTAERTFLAGMEKYQKPKMSSQTETIKKNVLQHQQETLNKRRVSGKRAAQYDYNNFLGLVILVQFNDKEFSHADYPAIAYDMFNADNYEGYIDSQGIMQECTGSVRDYFSDNSGGKFKPEFDIYGPYTIDYSQYDANGTTNAPTLINAAINAADGDIDYSAYDRDNNGFVDMIYFIFAGNGANYGGNDSRLFWPHRSVVYNPQTYRYVMKDGVYLSDYASSVELYGWTESPSTVAIDGIGTICHEFSHVLGLPDFYDSDYENSGGRSNHPNKWSVMADGSYNNIGRTPVGYSLYERYSVGFIDEPQKIEAEGSYTLEPLYSSYTGYRIDTPKDDEFFLLENRQKNAFKWDADLPGSGMLVYRVDFSDPYVWNNNKVNCDPSHNYYELIRACGAHQNFQEGYYDSADDAFPGGGNVKELNNSTTPASLNTWSGEPVKWGLSDIKMTDGLITFDVDNAYVLKSLTLPETASVGEGMKKKLELTIKPNINTFELNWESKNPEIATVDQEGYVTGVSIGSCDITVTGDNNISATCHVTVVNMDGFNIAEFKEGEIGAEVLLRLNDAQVLYKYLSKVYVRDATGTLTLNDLGLDVQKNDRLNGVFFVKLGSSNSMLQAMKSENTSIDDIDISAGAQVEPREVNFEDLSEEDYSDFVIVHAVRFEKINGYCYAVSDNKRVRVYTKFGSSVASLPSNYDGKYYDVEAIFGTERVGGNVIDEFYLMKTPVEVDSPSGINDIHLDSTQSSGQGYNLNGMRIESNYKGVVIKNGKKFIIK